MPTLKALIFDVDGTLADTERYGHRVAFNRAFAEAGLDWHWDEGLYGRLLEVTGGKERILCYAEDYLSSFQWPSEPAEWVADLHAIKTRHYQSMLRKGEITLRPGVAQFLRDARDAGMRLAIATTTTPGNVTALLASNLGAAAVDWFSVIAAGDSVGAKKPAPDVYLQVLDRLGTDADECFAFEDSLPGLQSATTAGLRTVVVTNDYTAEQHLPGAFLVASGWNDANLKKLIKNLLLGQFVI